MAILDFFIHESSNYTGDPANVTTTWGEGTQTPSVEVINDGSPSLYVAPQPALNVGFQVKFSSDTTRINDVPFFVIKDDSDNTLFALHAVNNSATDWVVHDFCYTDGLAVTTPVTIPSDMTLDFVRADVEFNSDVSAGYIRLFVGGQMLYERTGDTQYMTVNAQVTSAKIASMSGDDAITYFRYFFATDSSTVARTIEMVYQPVVASGKYAEFTGDAADMDIQQIRDDLYMVGAQGATQSFTLDDMPAQYDAYGLLAVGVFARARSDIDGVINVNPLICSGVSPSEQVSTNTLNSPVDYSSVRAIFDTAPDGTAWDLTKYSDLEVGVRTS